MALLSTIASDRRVGLLNVSPTGVRVTAPDLPSEGDDVIFQAESIQLFGQVIWSRDGQCGVAFAAPMSPDQVVRLQSETTNDEPNQP